MRQEQHLKQDVWLVLCCSLAAVVVAGTIFWLDDEAPVLSSDAAWSQAQLAASEACEQTGQQRCDYTLLDAKVMPNLDVDSGDHWQFAFYSPKAGPMNVYVMESGEVRVEAGNEAPTLSRVAGQ